MRTDAMYSLFKQRAAAISAEITEWRRHLHAHPERSYEEVQTTAFIAEKMRSFGYADIRTGFGPLTTGLRADAGSSGSGGKCVMLRADIDALPISTTADVPWRSQNPGVMHACGHEAHAAMLLGAAKLLKEMEAELPGAVRFLFQPGEEDQTVINGKATDASRLVVEAGALEGVGAAFACHVWGVFPAGVVFVTNGPTMMGFSDFAVTVKGHGTHGATPHLGRDPILACCELVPALHTITAREVSPIRPAVLSVGTIKGGTATNIMPEETSISGTIRTAFDDDREFICKRVGEMAAKTAEAHRCTATTRIDVGCSALINDAAMADIVREAASHIVGQDKLRENELITASEDFGVYAERVPSAFFFLGMADKAKGTGQSQHDPSFQVNDDVLADGAAMLAACAWRYLEGK